MSNRNDSFLLAIRSQPLELPFEGAVLLTGGGPGAFGEQPRSHRLPCLPCFFQLRANAGPRTQVSIRRVDDAADLSGRRARPGSFKRGGSLERINLDEGPVGGPGVNDSIIAVDATPADFARIAPRHAKVVELRVFAGLGVEETAKIMGVSTRSIDRDWQFARSLLMRDLGR